jgi:sugar phosphate isomerase/epimerase
MNLGGHDIGVCSWSLKTDSVEALVESMRKLGLEHTQLALGWLLDMDATKRDVEMDRLAKSGLTFTGGMIGFPGETYTTIASIRKTGGIVPTDVWPQRRERALAAGNLAQKLGLPMVTMHSGFIPPSNDPGYGTVLERVTELAKVYASLGLNLLMETGQERAHELLHFLNDVTPRNVGVNFDPANMILYSAGDPVEAVETLGRHIRHVHIKDAIASDNPGVEWGREVPWGEGDVDHTAFLRALEDVGYDGPLVIECEMKSGDPRNVQTGIATLESLFAEDEV